MKTINIILSFCLLMAVASCTKNDKTTIVPIGTEYYIDSIFSVVPRTDTLFWSAFGIYPEGPIPPNVNGAFVVAPNLRVATSTSLPIGIVEPNAYLRFSDQHNGLVTMELSETTDHVTDTVFVMGHDLGFTVYFIEDKVIENFHYQNADYRLKTRRGVVMTGTVDTVVENGMAKTVGLADFRMATVIMGMESEPEGAPLQPVGTYFIYKDGDGCAEQFDW